MNTPGHLYFAGMFVCFLVILVGGIYYNYVQAFRKQKDGDQKILVETDERERFFYVKKLVTLTVGILIFVSPIIFVYIFKDIGEDADDVAAVWMIFDCLYFAFVILVLGFVACLRSYVYIHEGGFECREIFCTTVCSKEEIELVGRTKDIIFVKRKGRRMPVILETHFADTDVLYGMLCGLGSDLLLASS